MEKNNNKEEPTPEGAGSGKSAEPKKEKMVSMYDPTVDAYREIPISRAKQFIKVAGELKKEIDLLEEE